MAGQTKSDYIAEQIEKRIAGGDWPPEGHLPTVRRLAVAYETSAVTIVKVLKALAARGVIRQIPGRSGYFTRDVASPSDSSTPGDDAPRARADEVASVLREEMLSGVYPPNEPLPQLKSLQARFGCSYATVRSALGRLVADGMVHREGKSYALSRLRDGRAAGSHVYVCGYPQMVEHRYEHIYTLLHAVEKGIQRVNWGELRFFLAGTQQRHVKVLPELPRIAPPDHLVAGYILIRYLYRGGWKRFLLSKRRIPLVIVDFDQMMEFEPPRDRLAIDYYFAERHRSCTILVPDNRAAGREVAQHLSCLGHRRIAFFTHERIDDPAASAQAWPRLRYEGVAEVYSTGDGEKRKMTVVDGSRGTGGSTRISFRDRTKAHLPAALRGLPEVLTEEMAFSSMYLSYMADVHRVMRPLFRRALEQRDITAWVCVNDSLAVLAHAFLAEQGVKVPGDISIVSFDNSQPSYRADLTSFDFGYDRIGHLAVSVLAAPRLLPAGQRVPWHVPGQLVVRGSSGAGGR